MIRLGIIGTAGRKPFDISHLSQKHMEWMAENVKCYIENILGTTIDQIILVSGGSAWADHVAVQLYLEGGFGGLELYLPTAFDLSEKKFIESHEGKALNCLHLQCQNKTGKEIFNELFLAVNDPLVEKIIKKGFFARNSLIAQKSNHLLAFTFGEGTPHDGGTYDTWKKTLHNDKLNLNLEWA